MEKLTPNVIILKDGPIMIEGKLSIVDSDDLVYQPEKCFLCRCGGSNKKPFCDGTHKKINFKDGKERKYPYFKEGEKVRCKKKFHKIKSTHANQNFVLYVNGNQNC